MKYKKLQKGYITIVHKYTILTTSSVLPQASYKQGKQLGLRRSPIPKLFHKLISLSTLFLQNSIDIHRVIINKLSDNWNLA